MLEISRTSYNVQMPLCFMFFSEMISRHITSPTRVNIYPIPLYDSAIMESGIVLDVLFLEDHGSPGSVVLNCVIFPAIRLFKGEVGNAYVRLEATRNKQRFPY